MINELIHIEKSKFFVIVLIKFTLYLPFAIQRETPIFKIFVYYV